MEGFPFSLQKKGCAVTHFDISQPMIDKAKELAAKAGVLDKITFVKGALAIRKMPLKHIISTRMLLGSCTRTGLWVGRVRLPNMKMEVHRGASHTLLCRMN